MAAGVKLAGGAAAELKRLWVDPTARGFGVGRRLVAALEGQAVAHGYWKVRLDTNRTLTEAIALYRSLGYEEIEAFNDEQYAHHWFEKRLGDAPEHRTPRGIGSCRSAPAWARRPWPSPAAIRSP